MVVKTKWPAAVVSRVGRGALALARQHEAVLSPRLAAGLIDGLSTDLDVIEEIRAGVPVSKTELREATLDQSAAAEGAQAFLNAARAAIDSARPTALQRAAFGRSLRIDPRKVSSVVAALEAFLGGAGRHPELTRFAGLLTSDLDAAKEQLRSLLSADATQETKKQTRKQATVDRDVVQARIERAVDAIVSAARIAFLSRPDITAQFVAVLPSSPKKKKPAA